MFVSTTAADGVVSGETHLFFTQRGRRVAAHYAGGRVLRGWLAGRWDGDVLRFRYAQREESSAIHGGQSVCVVEERTDGRLRLIEHFTWTTRSGSGTNVFDELSPPIWVPDQKDDGTMAGRESGDSNIAASIAPWLSVPDGQAAVEFYTAAFGAVPLERLEDDAGRVVVAQLSLGGARFWVQMDIDSSPATLGGISVRMIVAVADPDQLFERAVAGGATQISSMHDAHGWRTGRVSDPFGHHWEFAKPLGGAR
jgi:PhnB protein